MANDAVIGVKITGDGKNLEKALQTSGKRVDEFGKKAGDAKAPLEALGQSFKNAFIGTSIVAAATKLGSAADAVTILNNRLKLATGGGVEAAQAYAGLFAIAQQSRVSFTELGDTFAAVSRAGQELGISQQRLLAVTAAIGNAMAISGGSADSMKAALVQLGQGLASGVLRGEELNSVMEQSPRLARALADGLGVPLGELRKLGAQGKLTAEQVIGALEKSAPQLAREVQGAAVTFGQAFTVLGNATVDFMGRADATTDATKGLTGSMLALADGITAASKNVLLLDGLRVVGETVRVLWSDVAFVFERTGIEIGAIGAQIAAVLRGDFSGAAFIRRELVADAAAARAALNAYQKGVLSPAASVPGVDDSKERAVLARHRRPFKPSATTVKGGGTAREEARAQLAADLEAITNRSAALAQVFGNSQKKMEALRAAGLVDEGAYYFARRQFLQLDTEAQEKALTDEIARLQREKFSGKHDDKDQIDNLKKIADARAKLDKVRQDSASESELLDISEGAAMRKLAQYYRDAEDAAQGYFDALRNENARALAGVGAGDQERGRLSGRAQIEDKYSQQRRDVEKSRRDAEFNGSFGADEQAKYDGEIERIARFQSLALTDWDAYYAKRKELDADWTTGANDALADYFDSTQNMAEQTKNLVTKAFASMEDALVQFAQTGKIDFKSLANSIIADLIRIQVRSAITGPLANSLKGGAGGVGNLLGNAGTAIGALIGKVFGFADGGNPPVGVPYLVGEQGPELRIDRSPGTIIPNGKFGGGDTFNTTNNYTVGDVASMAQVRALVTASQKQTSAHMHRSIRYRGALS